MNEPFGVPRVNAPVTISDDYRDPSPAGAGHFLDNSSAVPFPGKDSTHDPKEAK
jgi:hypothetical protein